MPHPKFNTIMIETASRCDNHCPFCPVSYKPRSVSVLSIEIIYKILQELQAMDFRGQTHLHYYNEPLLDERLCSIIYMVTEMIPRSYSVISTNGNHLTKPLLNSLRAAGLNNIVVNRYNPKVKSKRRFADTLKSTSSAWDSDGKAIVNGARTFTISMVDKSGWLKHEVPKDRKHRLTNRSGNIPSFIPALTSPLKKKCVRPFRQLVINSEGDVVLCCNDYSAEVKFGNVNRMSLIDAWQSTLANEYRRYLAVGNRNLKLCSRCDWDGGVMQFNLKHMGKSPGVTTGRFQSKTPNKSSKPRS